MMKERLEEITIVRYPGGTVEVHLNIGSIVLSRMNKEQFAEFVHWCAGVENDESGKTFLHHLPRVMTEEGV